MRAALALGALVMEYLLLAVAFDGSNILRNAGGWSKLSDMGATVSVGVAVFSAGLIRKKDVLLEAFTRLGQNLSPVAWRWFAAHLLIFAGFAACTSHVFAPWGLSSSMAPLWAAAWLVLALATFASVLRAAFDRAWLGLVVALAKVTWGGLALGLLAYWAGSSSQRYWPWLAQKTLAVSGLMLSFLTKDVYLVPSHARVGLGGIEVEVAETCSGVEGIGLVLVLVGGYVYTFRKRLRFPRALWLIPIAVATVWLLNAARVALLIAIAAWVSPAIAFGGFHSKAGWIAVCAVILGTIAVAERTSLLARHETRVVEGDNPTAAYLMPLLVLIAIGMLTSLASAELDWLYGLRLLGAGAALWVYRRHYPTLVGKVAPVALALGVLTFLLWVALVHHSGSTAPPAAFTQASPALRAVWLSTRVLGTVVVVPIVEELAFRGFLQRRLIDAAFEQVDQRRFEWWSLALSALAFGALHENLLAGVLAGVAYSLSVYHRGRLVDSIAAHATTNALLAVVALGFGRWDLLG